MNNYDLPNGWELKTFTSVFDIQGGTQPPKSQFKDFPEEGYVRLLQIRDFGMKPVPTYIPNTGKWNLCKKDDILIARYGASIGRIVTGQEGAYNVALAKVTIPEYVDKRFALWLLKSHLFQNFITSFQRTAQSGFNKTDLKSIFLPIPPLQEQERIVAKLDSLFAHLETAKQGLEKIPLLLKQFRQAVLTQAVTGKLTEEWREGKKLGEWSLVEIGKICESIVPGRDKPKSFTGKTPWITTPCLTNKFITSNNTDLFLSDTEIKEVRAKVIPINSVVISIVGRFGIACVVKEKCVINQQLHAYLPSDKIIPEYLMYFIQTQEEYMNSISSSTTIAYINKTKANSIPINLPSLTEQTEIVRRVEALFSKADAIEAQYKKLKEQINQLPQAILAKAFRGEV
jgi:type I restriction enzyme S subunit